ncbi:Photosystem II PsbZ, reaction centre [Dillenia turbinata]|uniref:Photosystem II reaction center protein Z n=1 Tax=Dillenia turbinata TaxID=194707 RepID=A0AAN8ZUN1_9MAGN
MLVKPSKHRKLRGVKKLKELSTKKDFAERSLKVQSTGEIAEEGASKFKMSRSLPKFDRGIKWYSSIVGSLEDQKHDYCFPIGFFALIATSSILLISVPVVFSSPDGWSCNKNVKPQTLILFGMWYSRESLQGLANKEHY